MVAKDLVFLEAQDNRAQAVYVPIRNNGRIMGGFNGIGKKAVSQKTNGLVDFVRSRRRRSIYPAVGAIGGVEIW